MYEYMQKLVIEFYCLPADLCCQPIVPSYTWYVKLFFNSSLTEQTYSRVSSKTSSQSLLTGVICGTSIIYHSCLFQVAEKHGLYSKFQFYIFLETAKSRRDW